MKWNCFPEYFLHYSQLVVLRICLAIFFFLIFWYLRIQTPSESLCLFSLLSVSGHPLSFSVELYTFTSKDSSHWIVNKHVSPRLATELLGDREPCHSPSLSPSEVWGRVDTQYMVLKMNWIWPCFNGTMINDGDTCPGYFPPIQWDKKFRSTFQHTYK